MSRPNTKTNELVELLKQISNTEVEEAIHEYQTADDINTWLKELNGGRSRRYFLIWDGEKLDAKAIGKAALRSNEICHLNWHTDPIIDMLESLGFAIWDTESNGEFDSSAAKAYEATRRLARPGQLQFRREALVLWGNRCAISGTTLIPVLEAAHIVPHAQAGGMHAANSVVLRVDIHRLFDGGLIAVDPRTLSVVVKESVRSSYPHLQGKVLDLPDDGPTPSTFERRWREFSGG